MSRRCRNRASRRCCTTSRRSGLVLDGLLAHFEPIMEGFKAQTVGIEKGRICDRFRSILKRRSPLLGRKYPRAHILKGKSLKKKKIEEEEMGLSIKIVFFIFTFFLSFF